MWTPIIAAFFIVIAICAAIRTFHEVARNY
jgi:hypothetical protein